MYKQIIALTLLATVIDAQTTGWRNCGSGSDLGSIRQARIQGCAQTPCTFVRGESYRLEADAYSYTNSNSLPFAVVGRSLGIELPIHSGNACDYLISDECPVTNGRQFSFGITYEVPTWIPPVPSVVNGMVWNDFGDLVVCVDFDAIIN